MKAGNKILGFRGLKVYQKSFDLAMEIFELTKSFPKEEKYSLIYQIRRSTRSVCTNVGEAYRKRIYPNHFINKISDADAENTETKIWLDFSQSCNYLNKELHKQLLSKSEEIGKLLYHMMNNPHKFK